MVREALAGEEWAANQIREVAESVAKIVENEWRRDSSTATKAREITFDLLAEGFGANKHGASGRRLLELYSGRAPFQNWFLVCVRSRVSNWRRSLPARLSNPLLEEQEFSNTDQDSENMAESKVDETLLDIVRLALEEAFGTLSEEQTVLVRLVYLHGISKERLADLWDIHPSNVGRKIATALQQVRAQTLLNMKILDPFLDLEWKDCLALCARYPQWGHGDWKPSSSASNLE